MGKIAFLFSGQGAQYPGMGKDLYDNISCVKELFDMAEDIRPGTRIQCFESDEETLKKTENTQPCMFLTDYACAKALNLYGIYADAAAGFSLGEVVAITYSGILDDRSGFELVKRRAELMGECNIKYPGTMCAVLRADADLLEELCSECGVYAVNYNCPGQTSVAGNLDKMEAFYAKLEEHKISSVKLAVSGSFHTPYMKDASEGLSVMLNTLSVNAPKLPVYANYTAGCYPDKADEICELISMQVSHSVKWEETIRNMYDTGVDTFIECGPGQTLSGLVRKTLKGVNIYNVNDMESLKATCEKLGVTI